MSTKGFTDDQLMNPSKEERATWAAEVNAYGPHKLQMRDEGDTNPVADKLGCDYWCLRPVNDMSKPAEVFMFGGVHFPDIATATKMMNVAYREMQLRSGLLLAIAEGLAAEADDEIELTKVPGPMAKA